MLNVIVSFPKHILARQDTLRYHTKFLKVLSEINSIKKDYFVSLDSKNMSLIKIISSIQLHILSFMLNNNGMQLE